MKTATRLLVLSSLFAAGCSGDAGGPSEASADNPLAGTSPLGTGAGGSTSGGADPGAGLGNAGSTAAGTPATGAGTGSTNAGAGSTTGGTTTIEEMLPDSGKCTPGVPISSQIPRIANVQYNSAVQDIFGVAAASGSWSASFEPESNSELSATQWNQYKSTADDIASAVLSSSLGTELTAAAADPAAFEASVRSLGRRVFRRPMSDDEVARFTGLMDVTPAGTPEEIADALVYTMLISPSFLMRTELDAPEEMVPGTNQMAFRLSDHEVATRLSFLIWNSVPDAMLEAAADAGELQTKEQIEAQAARMVAPEFRDRVTPVIIAGNRFYANIDENSSLSRWGKKTHDQTLYPEYSPAQNAPSLAAMDMFFEEVGFDGQFEDLFLSNVAFVNQDTAPLYGLNAGDYGAQLERVELDATERPGFLTRAAFLSAYASEQSTSPILRGSYILSLMGTSVGAPIPGAEMTPVPDGTYENNRQATEALTSVEESCKACHENVINPPGFVLESYSAVGTVQTVDPIYLGAIDTAVDTVAFPDGAKPINNAYELMTELATGAKAREIYAKKWVSYATGRGTNDFDQCTAETIATKMASGAYPLSSVLADLTLAESFRYRVAGQ